MGSLSPKMEETMKTLKSFIEKLFKEDILFLTCLTVYILLIYWQVISKDIILSYDDNVLLTSLSKIENLRHYFDSILNGFILDIQPVRDFSFYLDFKIKAFFPAYSFHFTNVIVWICICYFVRKIFLKQSTDNYYIIGLLVLLYALSPVSANSVAWIAARKHLLSTLFIICATYLTLLHKNSLTTRRVFLISLFYLLSCYSQPINTLWIIWLGYYIYSNGKYKFSVKLLIINSIISLVSICTNFYYYKIIYARNVSPISKFTNYTSLDLGDPLLAIGRYFYQSLYPFAALPSTHYQGSWENMAGLILLTIFLAFCYKEIRKGQTSLLLAIIYYFFPLVLVTINMTNVFCSDTYLLNSSIGFYWCLLIFSEKLKSKNLLTFSLASYVLIVSIYTFNYVSIFNNEDELWLYSQKKEATSQTTVIASSIYVKQKRFKESFELIEELQERWPNQPYLPQVIAENLFYNPNIKTQLKIEKLLEIAPKMPSTYLYLSVLYGYEKDKEGLEKVLYLIFQDSVKFNMEFRGSEIKIAAIFLYTCEFYKLGNCKTHVEEFKSKSLYSDWNKEQLESYLQQLKKSSDYQVNI